MVETGTTLSSFTTVGTYTALTATLTNLQPSTTYYIRVRAKADVNSDYSDGNPSTANAKTLSLSKLQPPRNITLVGMTSTTLKYTFDPPADTNGLTGYSFYLNTILYHIQASSATREIEFRNLTPDTEYRLDFQSMGNQQTVTDSDVTTVYGTPLSERLVISSNNIPSSDTAV